MHANAQATSASVVDGARFGTLQFTVAALCAVVAMLDGFDTQAIAYVAPSIAEAWKLQSAVFGPIFGGGLLGLTIGALILSPLADRVGRKPVIVACVIAFGVCSLLTTTADTLQSLLIYRVLTGIGLGGAMPNIIALTNEYAPSRMKATLVTVMFCGFPLGSTLGGLVAAPLIQAYGWQSVFVVGGAAPLVLAPILIFFLPESIRFLASRRDRRAVITAILGKIDARASAEAFIAEVRGEPGTRGPRRFVVFELFREGRARRTVVVWIAFFMNLLVMYFLVNWLPSLLRNTGVSLQTAILSTALLNLGGVAGGIVLGRLIDRRNPYLILATAYAAAAVFIAVIASFTGNVPVLLTATVFAGVGVSGAQIGLNAVTAASYPTAIRSTGIGWALGAGRIGSILGPTLGGVLLGLGWTPASLLMAAVIPAVLAAIAVFSLRYL
jgi:MFS transporter, AAHS family, 4-hydroxybenzoate transporter